MTVAFSESLQDALKKASGKANLVIGKDSVVRRQSQTSGLQLARAAALTGLDGKTTQTGLFIVPAKDAALSIADIKGYRIILGAEDCDERNLAAQNLIVESGLPKLHKPETCSACSDGALKILELHNEGKKAATIISSYAKPLLEGCGTVKKGDLRVIGETDPVPFVVAFVNEKLPVATREAIAAALLDVGRDKDRRKALETKHGFVRAARGKKKLKSNNATALDWPGWRGRARDGRVAWLPASLAAKPTILWRASLREPGMGGVAATSDSVFVSDRELNDTADVFRCLNAQDGKERWSVVTPAPGHLDFGNSPRATPLVEGELVYLAGAFGGLQCVKRSNGELVWELDLRAEFNPDAELPWGMCASPLIVDGKLIVNPGAKDASLVALDPKTGAVIWKSPGAPAAYGSFLGGRFGGRLQVVGHDAESLGGWDATTGKRLWRIAPRNPKEFGVPTPIAIGEQLLISSENEGTRLYKFDDQGRIDPRPLAINPDLAPDCHTPVAVGRRVFGVWNDLYCLDLSKGLATAWRGDDSVFATYTSLVASPNRVLAITLDGQALLIDATADRFRIVGRQQLFTDDHGVYSHPALVGNCLYVRGSREMLCVNLGGR